MQNILAKFSEKHWAIAIFIFAFAIYANTILNDYNLDDVLVTQNHRLTSKGISAISEIFSSYYYEDDMGYKYGYRPITHASFAIEHSLFGEKVFVSHTINVFLYAISCLLVFFFVRKLKPDISVYFAVLVALLFAVHPIHTEVVASIKNRDEILSLLFGLLALLTAVSIDAKKSLLKNFIIWGLVLLFFTLSILSKNSTALFSVMIPIMYLLFVNHKKVIFPLLFSLAATSVNAFFLSIQKNEILLLFTVSFVILVVCFFMFAENRNFIKGKVLAFSITKKFINFIFFSSIILMIFALFFKIYLLFIIVFLMLGYGFFIIKKEEDIFKLSVFVFICASLMSMVLMNENLTIIAYIFLLGVNAKFIKQKKWQWFSVVLYTIFVSSYINQFGTPTGVEILIIALYFANFYFKPLLPIALVTILTNFNKDPFIILASIIGFGNVLFFLYQKKLNKENLFSTKKTISIGIVLMLLFTLNYHGNLIGSLNENFIDTHTIQVENSLDKTSHSKVQSVDRPLTLIENPLIKNWNYQHRIPTAFTTTKYYLQKLILPYPLLFYYGYDKVQIADFKSFDFYFAVVIVFLLLIIAFYNFKKNKLLSFGVFFMLLNLVPYSNLMTPVAGIVGERLTYVASLGFVLFFVALLMMLYEKYNFKKGLLVFVSTLLLLTSTFTIYRNSLWKDKLTLFKHDIHQLENSAQANALLAYAFLNNNNLNEGLYYLNNAIAVYPDFLNWWFDKGKVEDQLGQVENAIYSYEKALAMDSTFSNEPFFRLGVLYVSLQNYNQATFYLEKLLEKENSPGLNNYLASVYMDNNQPDAAIKTLERALTYFPNNYDLYHKLGRIYYYLGNNLALFYFEKAFAINPTDEDLVSIIEELQSI